MSPSDGTLVLGLWLDPAPAAHARRAFLRTLVAAKACGRRASVLDLRPAAARDAVPLDAEEQRWLEALDEAPAPGIDALREAGSLLVLAPAGRPAQPAWLEVGDAWLARTPWPQALRALGEAGQAGRVPSRGTGTRP